MVPMFTWGLVRSNFSLAIASCSSPVKSCLLLDLAHDPGDDFLADRAGRLHVLLEVHGVGGAALGAGAQVGGISEHGGKGDERGDDLGAAPGDLPLQVA